MVDDHTQLACVLATGVALASWTVAAPATAGRAIQPTVAPGGHLSALSCASEALCVAVGTRRDRAGRQVALAARWDGTRWSIQPTPPPGRRATASGLVAVSCNSSATCVAVGSFTGPSGARRPLAEGWNGGRWAMERTPGRGGLDGVSCYAGTECIAVGSAGALRWDGRHWAIQQRLRKRRLDDVSCASSTDCVAVGDRDIESDEYDINTFAERWTGHRWRVMRTPNDPGDNELVKVSCAAPSACTAVGYSEHDCDSCGPEPLVERWDGKRWSIAASPDLADDLEGISCTSSRMCTAVGSRYSVALDTDIPLAASWNGRRWTVQQTGRPDHATGGRFAAVSCTPTAVCRAVGAVTDRAGHSRIFSEHHAPGGWRVDRALARGRGRCG